MNIDLRNLLITEYIKHNYDWSNVNLIEFIKYSQKVDRCFNKYIDELNNDKNKPTIENPEGDLD